MKILPDVCRRCVQASSFGYRSGERGVTLTVVLLISRVERKCMSAALASVARPWPRSSFPISGGKKRDLNNVGVVVSGSEQVVHSVNPWDALGYQVIEDAVAAFDLHAFNAGARMLRSAMTQSLDNNSRKSEFSALAMFMDAYNLWSRSEYGKAFNEFEKCEKRLNDLAESLRQFQKNTFKTISIKRNPA